MLINSDYLEKCPLWLIHITLYVVTFISQEVIGVVKKRFVLNYGKGDGDEADDIAEGMYRVVKKTIPKLTIWYRH